MKARFMFISVMLIFGSIGLFVKNIDLSSSEIALFRGAAGSIFLIVASFLVKQKINLKISKKNLVLLILSGSALGFNWIFLFESYRFTTISNATLSYYFAPIIVMVLAPFILKEAWTWKKGVSMFIALAGLFLVIQPDSGASSGSFNHLTGISYGLSAAAFYASVILMNKFIKGLSDFETTVMQLSIATLVLFPYTLMTESMSYAALDIRSIVLLAVLGIVHTGFAYMLYFSSLQKLNAQTIGVFSYIDPISAVIMAAMILGESMSLLQMIGGILILGSALLSELPDKKRNGKGEAAA